jgi:hypothetical protein
MNQKTSIKPTYRSHYNKDTTQEEMHRTNTQHITLELFKLLFNRLLDLNVLRAMER